MAKVNKRRVQILAECESDIEDSLIILTNAPQEDIQHWIDTDKALNPKTLKAEDFYVHVLYDPEHNAPDDVYGIGYDEQYDSFGARRDEIMKREKAGQDLLMLIDEAVQAKGMKVLDGDAESLIVRYDGQGPDFLIRLEDA